jgi:hypothetical protein
VERLLTYNQKNDCACTFTPTLTAFSRATKFNLTAKANHFTEYPSLRVFTVMPGIVRTALTNVYWKNFAHDHEDLTGMLALYLNTPEADYLNGSFLGVNWDVEELKKFKDQIVQQKLLAASWLPILPVGGGNGLGRE